MKDRCGFWLAWVGVVPGLLFAAPAIAGPYEENARAGQQAMARGDLRAAAQAFQKAADAERTKSLPHKYLADIHYKQQRYKDAVAAARRALAIDPKDGDTHYNLGMYLLYASGMQPSDEVISALEKAVTLNRRDAQAASNLGAVLYLLKRYQDALPYFEQAAKITPFWAPYWSNLGEALLAAGQAEEASKAFAGAAEPRRLGLLSGEEHKNTLGDIYLNWGKAEEKRGLTGNAQKHLQRVVDQLSGHAPSKAKVEEAKKLLADIDRRLQEQDAARKRLEEERLAKIEAERKRREEDQRRREEELRKQQEALRLQQEELARQQEEERKRQQEEAERKRREEELRKQQEAVRLQQEALERKRLEEEAERKRQEEELKRKQQDTTPPVVTITDTGEASKPAVDGVTTRDLVIVATTTEAEKTQTQLIAGVASDNVAVVEVTVAGKPATIYQSRDLVIVEELGFSINFSAEVAIKPGENRIEIVATDRAGNQGKHVLVINGKEQEKEEAIITATGEVAAAAAQRYALLVGVNKYESPEITPLRFSVRDVRTMYELLIDPKRAGLNPDNVILLTDDQTDPKRTPTRNNIYDGLVWLKQMAKPEDLVIVYYSGHGFKEKETATAYLLPTDTRTNILKRTAIPNDEFLESLAQIEAKKKVIILDACHSGGVSLGAKAEAKLPDEYYTLLMQSEGTVTIASCSGDEQSYEYPGRQQGAFTHFLCEGLTGKADSDGNGVVTFQEAASYVVKGVSEWAKRQGLKQTPLTHLGNARFDIPLSAVREVELERKKQQLVATLTDAKLQRYSVSLLEKEPKSLSDKESLALMVLEQVLRGETPKTLYEELIKKFSLI